MANLTIDKRLLINDNKIYLVEKITDCCCFFAHNTKICFGVKSEIAKSTGNIIRTSYLAFVPSMKIKPISLNFTFGEEFFDLLFFMEEPEGILFDSFVSICKIYSNNLDKQSFYDFFNSLLNLFKKNSSSLKQNYIGFFGELSFIKYVWENSKIDLTPFWHLKGEYSRYDFTSNFLNADVKTTTKDELTFKIKHSQIFNGDNNFLVLMKLRESQNSFDFDLKSLIQFFQTNIQFSNNLRFQVELLKNIDLSSFSLESPELNLKYSYSKPIIYKVSMLKTISDIPYCISNIVYDYSFDEEFLFDYDYFIANFNSDAWR